MLRSYEIQLIPNYGNDEIIIETVNSMNILTPGKTRESGFIGCDVPVILDIKCRKVEAIKLEAHLRKVATDTFTIFEKCDSCGHMDWNWKEK